MLNIGLSAHALATWAARVSTLLSCYDLSDAKGALHDDRSPGAGPALLCG